MLIKRQDCTQIVIGEPLDLLTKVGLGPAQRLATGEQFLRQLGSAMGLRHGFSQRLR
jgi:hypothetical protein